MCRGWDGVRRDRGRGDEDEKEGGGSEGGEK